MQQRLSSLSYARLGVLVVALAVCLLRATAQPPATPAENEPRITNVFLESDIRAALQDIANEAGVNIIMDPTVQGPVSLQLEEVPLSRALTLVLMSGGFYYKKIAEDTYIVCSGDPVSPMFPLISETESIPLSYLKVADLRELAIARFYDPYIRLDPVNNCVLITAPRQIIDRLISNLALIDRRPVQIMIEAVITEISSSEGSLLDIDWERVTGVQNPAGTETITFHGLTLGYANEGMRTLLLSLESLITNGSAHIQAVPRITTLNGKEAEIFVGREEYFSILAGNSGSYPYYRLESIKSGITLRILPRITNTNEITLDFSPEVSDVIGKGESGLPVVNRRRVQTTLRVRDGETVVVGGLASEILSTREQHVPLLGRIPLVNFLFRSSDESVKKSETTVLLTPHILYDLPVAATGSPGTP